MKRQEYEMTEDEFESIKKASRPVPAMKIGDYTPSTPQENANTVWKRIAKNHGVKWDSIQPLSNKGPRHFSAIPIDN